MSPVRVLLATRNANKLIELRRILASSASTGLQVIGLDDVPPFPETPETAATFEANALAKARDAAAATGLPAVADDSGLEVDALNGMPGVLSARWAGRHGDDAANLQLVLDQLADVPAGRRGAAFVCAAALVVPPGADTVVRGQWRGTLSCAARGSNGFGYDPIFVPDGDRRTSAELDPAEKDAASHRGRALRALLPALRQLSHVVVASAHDLHDLAHRQLGEEHDRRAAAQVDASVRGNSEAALVERDTGMGEEH